VRLHKEFLHFSLFGTVDQLQLEVVSRASLSTLFPTICDSGPLLKVMLDFVTSGGHAMTWTSRSDTPKPTPRLPLTSAPTPAFFPLLRNAISGLTLPQQNPPQTFRDLCFVWWPSFPVYEKLPPFFFPSPPCTVELMCCRRSQCSMPHLLTDPDGLLAVRPLAIFGLMLITVMSWSGPLPFFFRHFSRPCDCLFIGGASLRS